VQKNKGLIVRTLILPIAIQDSLLYIFDFSCDFSSFFNVSAACYNPCVYYFSSLAEPTWGIMPICKYNLQLATYYSSYSVNSVLN